VEGSGDCSDDVSGSRHARQFSNGYSKLVRSLVIWLVGWALG
jgi:hypothetical protein